MNWQEYKEFLKDKHVETEDTPSDKYVKQYVSSAFGSDEILSKMIGLKMLNNGILDKNLCNVYIMGKLIGGNI